MGVKVRISKSTYNCDLSRTFFAPASDISDWQWMSDEVQAQSTSYLPRILQSDPWIYESPKMFRHGSDLYLVARTDPGGPFLIVND